MHDQFVEPTKRFADVIIPTGLNTVALELVIARLKEILTSKTPKAASAEPREN
jgi:uridine kinase